MSTKPKVVVIGGGPGGAHCARDPALNAIAEVTLVDTKDYHEATPSTLRAFTEPVWIDRCTWKHEEYLSKVGAKFVRGTVTRVEAKAAHLADGRVLPFDYVVIAAGSSTAALDKTPASSAVTREDRAAWFRAQHDALAAAKNVLIVGGGPVGVEFAGEVLTDMPGKKITLVQSGPRLFAGGTPPLPDKYAESVAQFLRGKGVTLIFDDKVDTRGARGATPGATYNTAKGATVAADFVFVAVGASPNTEFYDPGRLDPQRRVVVDECLRVKGAEGHFAVGDCAATPDAKYAFSAMQHGQLVAKNIAALARGRKPAPRKPVPALQVLSLGRADGKCLLPFGECCGCCAVSLKSKDLALGMARKMFGLKA